MNLLRGIEKIRALAQTGLHYTKDKFEIERFEEIHKVAEQLWSFCTGLAEDKYKEFAPFERGYITPKVDVRAAVFRDGKILLCKELRDGLWTLPGGWADVGISPAENAVKETFEESGFHAKVLKLIAVFDKDKHDHPPGTFHLYKMFFLCDFIGGTATDSNETAEAAFFSENEIPPLSLPRVTPKQIAMCFAHYRDRSLPTQFD